MTTKQPATQPRRMAVGAALRGLGREMYYALHVMVRPFDGYWDLKHEKRGSLRAAVGLLLLLLAVRLAEYQFSGFFFVTQYERENVNILREIAAVFLPYILWVIASWGFTTLLDGEGSMRDIAIATAYAVTPMIIVNIPLMLVSNLVTLEEGTFITVLRTVAVVWSGLLLFVSLLVTHQYTIPKAIGTIILSLLGMAIVIFLAMLIVSLAQQVITFIDLLVREAQLRWL